MKVRYKGRDNQWIEGESSKFNPSSVMPSEVIVMFDDGSADSMPISKLEVFVRGDFVPMLEAFRDGWIESDVYNLYFMEEGKW